MSPKRFLWLKSMTDDFNQLKFNLLDGDVLIFLTIRHNLNFIKIKVNYKYL